MKLLKSHRLKQIAAALLCFILLFCCGCRKNPTAGGQEELSSFYEWVPLPEIPVEPEETAAPEESSSEQVSSEEMAETPVAEEPSSVPVQAPTSTQPESQAPEKPSFSATDELRAVWIPFMELSSVLTDRTERQFTAAIAERFRICAANGLNTVIVHARSHADAFYNSSLFPVSAHFTGRRQETAPYDPLAVMVREAHAAGLRIEAWVNPYRGPQTEYTLTENEPLARWLDTDKVFVCGEYYYFNPGDPEVQQLIIDGVCELVERYDIDGLHFDDYFYPTGCGDFDAATVAQYGGGKTVEEFRTESVNRLISSVYAAVKARKNIPFGVAPQGNIQNCLTKSFADVLLWGSTPGYVDYLAPQLYWSYEQGSLPYDRALAMWKQAVTSPQVKLYVGLAAYRVGTDETWSGGNILARQVADARKLSAYGGFLLFRYDFYFGSVCDRERAALQALF